MDILQEKSSRRYFTFLLCSAAALLLFALSLSWLHGAEMKRLLFEKEQMIASSLIEQGVPTSIIAGALTNSASSEDGLEFLRQIGHTRSVSFRLFPSIHQSVLLFTAAALLLIGVFAAVFISASVSFLNKRENLYRTAAHIISRFSDGHFETHLPQNESGTLFQLFASIEELATALQAKNEREQSAREFLKNMISDLSHQLKTPLAALSMYMEIISEEPDHPETVQRFSKKSMQSLERIEQIILSLLKIARLDSGSIFFHPKPTSVSELIALSMEEFNTRAELEEKQILVTGDASDTLFCDPEWTSEAIGNLIKNALDHTDAGGTICISWQRSPSMFRLSISDDGCGIAPEDIHHIFKRFYRSRQNRIYGNSASPDNVNTRRNARQGVGLGLPLAKAIIEGQGGTLTVTSKPGEGASFIISFLTDS